MIRKLVEPGDDARACASNASWILPSIVRQCKGLLPGVRLLLQKMNRSQQEAAFHKGEIDVGITRSPFAKKLARELELKTILREPLLIAIPPACLQEQEDKN